jgi:tRNA dimethylallyltransferase
MFEIPVICGATASGKTELGIMLAENVGGEIVSMDSRQIYRGMDVGTAKPTAEEQARARHHLIDVADPGERYTAADFVAGARTAIRDIIARDRIPIIVGGTPFYLSALLGGFEFCGVDSDPDYRERLREEAGREGTAALHARLAAADPAAAERIHTNDLFRIVRALEILKVAGVPPSSLRAQGAAPADSEFGYRVFCLYTPRKILYERINKRVEFMYNRGLIGETKSVLETFPSARGFLTKTIGYAQSLDFIEGLLDLDGAADETRKQTRRFAKRQLTWLRALSGAVWLNTDAGEGDGPLRVISEEWARPRNQRTQTVQE